MIITTQNYLSPDPQHRRRSYNNSVHNFVDKTVKRNLGCVKDKDLESDDKIEMDPDPHHFMK